MNANGVVLYQGPSRIDGAPIVVIATGLQGKSSNAKTGAMIQTWILCADVSPMDALRTGKDVAVCGGCEKRAEEYDGKRYYRRSCYVNVGQAPRGIWECWKNGAGYAVPDTAQLATLFAGKVVRLGSYGDPAAVPLAIWDAVLEQAEGWTGYTHQMRSPKLRDVLKYCQVSADSLADAQAAHAAGVGSFRVLLDGDGEQAAPWEMVCPASKEAGYATNCASCQACNGWNGANVAIRAHGSGSKHLKASTRRPLSLPVLNPSRMA